MAKVLEAGTRVQTFLSIVGKHESSCRDKNCHVKKLLGKMGKYEIEPKSW